MTIAISKDVEGTRLDRYLKRLYPFLPQSLIEKSLRQEKIQLNGQKTKASARLQEGQILTLFFVPKPQQQEFIRNRPLTNQDIKFIESLILWEDQHILVINKPPGLASQGGTGTSRHLDGLLQAYGQAKNIKYRLVHRLDRDTSGVMVLAKDLKMANHLVHEFREKRVQKIYWAVVLGVPKVKEGVIDLPIRKDVIADKEKMIVDPTYHRPALTKYRVLKVLGKTLSLIELQPQTGRTHQLRVHLSSIGHPILGDNKYGRDPCHTLHLHAKELRFFDLEGDKLTFTAPLSDLMAQTLQSFS
ncbi:MAG: RluA family pseudouridine synthase [Proteobacteria bacterium]|nr:RluA family pseudouridine synthase [Pseudomonadota bacterium]